MVKRTGPTNVQLRKLVQELKKKATKEKAPIWKKLAAELEKPARIRREVNLYKIGKAVREGETAVVPGKVLGTGSLGKDVTVAAWRFSSSARDKVKNGISISQLMEKNPKGKKVRIIG